MDITWNTFAATLCATLNTREKGWVITRGREEDETIAFVAPDAIRLDLTPDELREIATAIMFEKLEAARKL